MLVSAGSCMNAPNANCVNRLIVANPACGWSARRFAHTLCFRTANYFLFQLVGGQAYAPI